MNRPRGVETDRSGTLRPAIPAGVSSPGPTSPPGSSAAQHMTASTSPAHTRAPVTAQERTPPSTQDTAQPAAQDEEAQRGSGRNTHAGMPRHTIYRSTGGRTTWTRPARTRQREDDSHSAGSAPKRRSPVLRSHPATHRAPARIPFPASSSEITHFVRRTQPPGPIRGMRQMPGRPRHNQPPARMHTDRLAAPDLPRIYQRL